MFSDNFTRCFENFFQFGTDPFFRSPISNNFSSSFGIPNSVRSTTIRRPTNNNVGRRSVWSVAEAMGQGRRDNDSIVNVNNDRLQWYDSNSQRPLVPLPSLPARSVYLSRDELNLIKTEIYKKVHSNVNNNEDESCDICLEIFKSGTKLKILPCRHKFHGTCVDKWLLQRPVCPHCRAGVRSGLKKQLKNQERMRVAAVARTNGRQNPNKLTPEEMDRRRRQNNAFYLRRRQRRLGQDIEPSNNSTTNSNKTETKVNNSQIVYHTNNKDVSQSNTVELENVTNTNEAVEPDTTQLNEMIFHDGMNLARAKAVTAALKRLELSKNDDDQEKWPSI